MPESIRLEDLFYFIGKTAQVIIHPVGLRPLPLQFWPESLTDNLEIEHSEISAPGSDGPLISWIRTGKRTISFKVILYRETLQMIPEGRLFLDKYNYDINQCVAYLRSLMYPKYQADGTVVAPRIIRLKFPKTNLNIQPIADTLNCVMTDCSIEYKKWFPNGVPRLAEVDLSFQELIVSWRGREELEKHFPETLA